MCDTIAFTISIGNTMTRVKSLYNVVEFKHMGLKPLGSSDVFICYINYSLRFSLPPTKEYCQLCVKSHIE